MTLRLESNFLKFRLGQKYMALRLESNFLKFCLGPVIHGITLARLTLILKATSTEKHVRRLKAFLRKLIVRLQSGDIKKHNSQFLLLMHAILFERPVLAEICSSSLKNKGTSILVFSTEKKIGGKVKV